MTTTDILWHDAIQASLVCCLVLTMRTLVLRFVRQPADRLRVIGTVVFLTLLSTIRLEAEDAAPPKKVPAQNAAQRSSNATVAVPEVVQADAATWDESQLEEGVVTGVLVRASDGSPVADATVILHAGGSNKTRSDAEGRFRLEKISARSYAYPVWAHQGNLVTQKVSVSHLRTAKSNVVKFAPFLLKMTAGKQARFTVISGLTGKPIPGATVRFGYPDRRLVTTDEQGIATVEGLLPEGYDVTIEADGHARQVPKIELSQSEALTDYKITLTSGGVVRGIVVDEGGKPVPEIEVIYRIGSGTGFHGDAFRSDAEGRFQHRFLPLETPVEVSSIANRSLASAQTVTVTAKQREIEVRLVVPKRPAGGSIAGTVKDQQGRPIVGVDVTSRGNNANELKTKTDAKGAFVLHDLAKGFMGYEIGVSTNGFAPQLVPVNPGTSEKPGAVTVTLEPGHTIRGRVQFEGGAPAKGVLVSARSSSFFEMLRSYDVDDDGRFQIDSLPKDARFDAYLKGYARIMNVAWELDRAEPVTVTLESPGIIRGRVLDANTKQPVTRFRVSLSFSRSRQPSDPQGTYENEWSHPGISFESKKGEFVVAPLTNGFPAELTIEAEGYGRGVIERAVAAKGDRAKTIDITLKPVDLSKLFTLSGQFLDHAGKPKSDVQLRLIVSTDPPTGNQDNNFNWSLIKNGQLGQKSYCEQFLSGTTNAEGRFEFKQILPGKSLQLAYWGSGVPQGKSLAFDETKAGGSDDVTIKLPEPAKIRGSIDRSKLAAAESIHVSLNSQSFHDYKLKLRDDQTEFEVDDLPPGEFSVLVSSKPVSFTKDGNTFYTSPILAHRKVRLKAGQVEEIRFVEPDPPQK